MLEEAAYCDGQRSLRVSVAREQVLLQSEEILNFPRIIELEGDGRVLAYGSGRHGGEEGRPVAVSDDFGATWTDPPKGLPMSDDVLPGFDLGVALTAPGYLSERNHTREEADV